VALRDAAEVEPYAPLREGDRAALVEDELLEADVGARPLDGVRARQLLAPLREAPQLDDRRDRDVEGAVRFLGDLLRDAQDRVEARGEAGAARDRSGGAGGGDLAQPRDLAVGTEVAQVRFEDVDASPRRLRRGFRLGRAHGVEDEAEGRRHLPRLELVALQRLR